MDPIAPAATPSPYALLRQHEVLQDAAKVPGGIEVHPDGEVVHEVNAGDGWAAIAGEYSRAFGVRIPWRELRAVNAEEAPGGMLRPGQQLELPWVEQSIDMRITGAVPGLLQVGSELQHEVQPGESLASIARFYSKAFGLNVTAKSLYHENATLFLLHDLHRLPPGLQLRVPGVSFASEQVSLMSARSLRGELVATRTARDVTGGRTKLRTDATYTASAAAGGMRDVGSDRERAVALARRATARTAGESAVAVVQTRDGHYQLIALERWGGDPAPIGARQAAIAIRAELPGLVAISQGTEDGRRSLRRYDI